MSDARPASVKAFFILEQRNIYTWLCVPLTEHIKTHLTYFREKSKREERTTKYWAAFDILSHKLRGVC